MNITELIQAVRDDWGDPQDTLLKTETIIRLLNRGMRETLKITEALVASKSITVTADKVLYLFNDDFGISNLLKIKRVLYDNKAIDNETIDSLDKDYSSWRSDSSAYTISRYAPWGQLGIKVNPPANSDAETDGKTLTLEYVISPLDMDTETVTYPFTYLDPDTSTNVTVPSLYTSFCEPLIAYALWKFNEQKAMQPGNANTYIPLADRKKKDFYELCLRDKEVLVSGDKINMPYGGYEDVYRSHMR